MPNLFPEELDFDEFIEHTEDDIAFKGSYAFDFETGDFIKGSNGKVAKVGVKESYIQWCNKCLNTSRFKHLSYSDDYGQEYYTLIGSGLSKEAIELEVERMTEEALFVHPYTDSIYDFDFSWNENKEELYFSFEVRTIEDERITFEQTIEVR